MRIEKQRGEEILHHHYPHLDCFLTRVVLPAHLTKMVIPTHLTRVVIPAHLFQDGYSYTRHSSTYLTRVVVYVYTSSGTETQLLPLTPNPHKSTGEYFFEIIRCTLWFFLDMSHHSCF